MVIAGDDADGMPVTNLHALIDNLTKAETVVIVRRLLQKANLI